ncbi:MAG: hypothetical protein LC808_31400 [Actinobacteria bacterium]|nr:hypothetical protein [Actinomycetota bacterium]
MTWTCSVRWVESGDGGVLLVAVRTAVEVDNTDHVMDDGIATRSQHGAPEPGR